MREVVIVAATRTAIGAFQGSLAKIPAVELGATVIRTLLDKSGLPADAVDEVVMGHVLTSGAGQNTTRQAAVRAGLPVTVPSLTVNKVCGSGLKATHLAAQSILLGDADVVVAGGMESMSLAPYVVPGLRTGLRMGHGQVIDTMIVDGLWDAFNQYHMGITAENLAKRYNITREQQDEYAVLSQTRATVAIAAGRFAAEITPVHVPQAKGNPVDFAVDEQPRAGTDLAGLAKLRPAFDKEGTVTAGNASTLNDGAAAVIMMSAEHAAKLGMPVLARVVAYASSGVDPAYMGEGPISATRRCLQRQVGCSIQWI